MNNSLNISFKKLALLLLPISLRQTRLYAFLEATTMPFQTLLSAFKSNRLNNIYVVNMNGQVCRLRRMLNDNFDFSTRRIYIKNGYTSDWLKVWRQDTFNNEDNGQIVLTEKASSTVTSVTGNKTHNVNDPVMVYKQGSVGSIGYDFFVVVPEALRASFDENRMRVLIDEYKLVSKRYNIIYE